VRTFPPKRRALPPVGGSPRNAAHPLDARLLVTATCYVSSAAGLAAAGFFSIAVVGPQQGRLRKVAVRLLIVNSRFGRQCCQVRLSLLVRACDSAVAIPRDDAERRRPIERAGGSWPEGQRDLELPVMACWRRKNFSSC
jgi:hypothetical protein